jgi:hypothetical protein
VFHERDVDEVLLLCKLEGDCMRCGVRGGGEYVKEIEASEGMLLFGA